MTGRKKTIAGVATAVTISAAATLLFTTGVAGARDRLSEAELVAEADRICLAANEELGPIFGELFPTGTETPPADEAAPLMAEAAEIIDDQMRALVALKPSSEQQAQWLEIEKLFRDIDRLVQRSAQLAAKGDTEGYLTKLGEANEVGAKAAEIFAELGSEGCAG